MNTMSRSNQNRRAFKPSSRKGTTSFHLRQYAQATLGGSSLKQVVKLPEGEDLNEWLAYNVVEFYNQINLVYSALTSDFCTKENCPEMKATDEFEYLWQDSDKYKKPTQMSAPQYVDHLMKWVQKNLDDAEVFPVKIGTPFPASFYPLVLQFYKRLYRVHAHMYCHHYPVIDALNLSQHLNTSFKHFVLFVREFDLDQGKDFYGPLAEMVDLMVKSEQ